MLKALIFDVDGTLADTESAHRDAFNQAFAALGLDWHWDLPLYTELLHVSGGKERIQHYWQTHHPEQTELGGLAPQDAVNRLHALKTAAYEAAVNSGAVQLRPGVLELMAQAHSAGLQLAIATTTSPPNIAALLSRALGVNWRSNFGAVGDALTAPVKKPDPQVYLQVMDTLQRKPSECIAFEDSFNGLRASLAAGLPTVVTPTSYTEGQDFSGALRLLPDLAQVDLGRLRAWHTDLTT